MLYKSLFWYHGCMGCAYYIMICRNVFLWQDIMYAWYRAGEPVYDGCDVYDMHVGGGSMFVYWRLWLD